MAYRAVPASTIESSPWTQLLNKIPDTIMAFVQLNMQLQQNQINREHSDTREDLRFARQDYLQAKKREDSWRDVLSKKGYSAAHITQLGTDWMDLNTEDISTITNSTEQNVLELQELSADLTQWKKKGLELEKVFAADEAETRETEYRKLVMSGGAHIYTEKDKADGNIPKGKKVGDVYGTGEFAAALKSLSPGELEKLKDINVRTAIQEGLRDDATAIKDWSALMAGQKVASEIGQKRSNVMWKNIIRTADRYSGRENITRLQADLVDYNEYQDAVTGNLTVKGQNLELLKADIGAEYEYLAMGRSTDLPENPSEEQILEQHRRHIQYYNIMSADFDVATPKPGGYGEQGTPGNQLKLKETIAAAYNNYQNIIAGGDKDEADLFSTKALKYLGVNFNDSALIEELGLQPAIDRTVVTEEILANLDYMERLDKGTLGPVYWDPEFNEEPTIGPSIPEGGLPVPVEDVGSSYYQQNKDYLDMATEAVWGPEAAAVLKAVPLYKGVRAGVAGYGALGRHATDAVNRYTYEAGSTLANIPAVILNQAVKAVTGYSPGLSGERGMTKIFESGFVPPVAMLGKIPEPLTDPDYSFGTYTPEGGFWSEDMKSALGQFEATNEQLSEKPLKLVLGLLRQQAVADSLAAVQAADTTQVLKPPVDTLVTDPSAIDNYGRELAELYFKSDTLQNFLPFNTIFNEWQEADFPDLVDWLLGQDINLEEHLIR